MKKSTAIRSFITTALVSAAIAFSSPIQLNAQSVYEYIAPRTAVPELPEGFTGIGPVVSGSVDYSKIPSKARKFLQKHCDGHAVVKCEKEYTSGDFEIALADGIEMEFDAKGNIVDITAPDNYSLAPALLKAVVPGKLYNLLDHNGFKSCVEAVHHDSAGYRLDVADPVFDQVCYDSTGVLTLIVDK
ncbi:MAG: hypothetical protein HDS68_03445 [Bacteroidales bacterium]|nr:hypothetical protein [Bacteroidales bacterium]